MGRTSVLATAPTAVDLRAQHQQCLGRPQTWSVGNEISGSRVKILLTGLDTLAQRRRRRLIQNLEAASWTARDFDSVQATAVSGPPGLTAHTWPGVSGSPSIAL